MKKAYRLLNVIPLVPVCRFYLLQPNIWQETEKTQNHSNQRTILSFLMPPAGLEPALCRQKGILSPSCLPAFGKVNFCSLHRLIFHCERDFSPRARGIRIFWQDNITTFFVPCQSCKIVSPCRARSSERPGPGAAAGGVCSAQMRSSGWVVVWWGYWWSHLNDGLSLIFEKYLKRLMWFWATDDLDDFLSVPLSPVQLLNPRSLLLSFFWNFPGSDFEAWS